MNRNYITVLYLVLVCFNISFSQNCSAPSSNFTPINDLVKNTFTTAWGEKWQGGLYPIGSNEIPESHKNKGIELAQQIQCLDTIGKLDVNNGKIVWLSIGMSNCTQETQQFIPMANRYIEKNPNLVFVDGAQGGQTAQVISAPWHSNYNNFWTVVNNRLAAAGVTSKQVQVIWLKEANQANNSPIKTHYDSLVVQFRRIANELQTRFPNVKICYLASRISGRYANTALNPEPYAYYTGWAIKKVIEDQINNNSQLTIGTKSPWLGWGIYMWSDGDIPQKNNPDVFISCPSDLNSDGTHPSTIGAQKVGSLLLKFFSTDATSMPWFKNKSCNIINKSSYLGSEIIKMNTFPNPFRNELTISFSTNIHNAKLSLFNSRGQIFREMNSITGNSVVIERNELSSGFYWIKLEDKFSNIFGIQKILID